MSRYLEYDFDLVDVVETWVAERQLPKAMRAFLAEEHQRSLDEPAWSPPIAPANYCTELDLPEGSTWPEVVASILDALTGRPTWERLRKVQIALDLPEEVEP
jgi:hypothetical protein